MKKLLVSAFLLVVQGSALAQGRQPIHLKDAISDFPGSQLQLGTNAPVSIEVSQGERAAYEKLAEIAGLNIVIDPDFRDRSVTPFKIESADVVQAFDILSAQTGSFVEVLNSNTVIVSPDNATKRRDYEPLVLKTFYFPNVASQQRLTEATTAVRSTLNVRYLVNSVAANAIMMRDTPARVAAAEKLIGLSMPVVAGSAVATRGETLPASHILTLESGSVRDSTPSRSILSVAETRPISLDVKESTRAIFERLARAAGLNVIFEADFRSIEDRPFKVDNLNILDALDVLALQTRTFWEPVDSKTIVVAPDNQAKRRDFENVSVKTFYLPDVSQVQMVEILTSLRTILNARYAASVAGSNAIVMRDTATKLALAEKIISDLRKSGGVVTAAGFPSGSESGFIQNRRAAQSLGTSPAALESKVPGPLSFDANDTARATYEAVTATAGLRVVFDSRFQDSPAAPFKVDHVGIADALDYLALQTRTIWRLMDRDTVLVATDTQTARADLLPKITKTIDSRSNINEIVTALRSILNVRQISTLDHSIVVTDTAEIIAFSEKMVRDLETPAGR